MKPLVIYHADCTDGFGAAFAAWLKLGDEAEYLPMQYGTKLVEKADIWQREVYVLDFSLPRDEMNWLFEGAKRVVWLDHHKTAFEMWCGKYEKGIHYTTEAVTTSYGDRVLIWLNDNKSGALLAWEYFHPSTEVPMLIRHIDDRDRWQFKLEGSKELHAALASYKPWKFWHWRDQFGFSGQSEDYRQRAVAQAITEGKHILRAQDAHVKSMVKQARKCSIQKHLVTALVPGSFDGLALNTPMHMSEVGHELANQSGTFGLVWYVGSDNSCKCSLRSNGDYDVSAIARAFGGGGHRNAAGFETDIETLMGWLK